MDKVIAAQLPHAHKRLAARQVAAQADQAQTRRVQQHREQSGQDPQAPMNADNPAAQRPARTRQINRLGIKRPYARPQTARFLGRHNLRLARGKRPRQTRLKTARQGAE